VLIVAQLHNSNNANNVSCRIKNNNRLYQNNLNLNLVIL
jgi:hypothetical protein